MDIDFGRILSGVGIVACIGGILLVVLIAWAVRSFGGRRNAASRTGTMGQRQSQPWDRQGAERPRYDDDRIESSGGFGGSTSGRSRDLRNDRPSSTNPRVQDDRISRQPRSLDQDNVPDQNQGDLDDRLRRQRRERDDDDNVSSRGGFGGG